MINEPRSESLASSPGQSARREELIRIFDKLDNEGKQELLRLAKELAPSSWNAAHHRAAGLASGAGSRRNVSQAGELPGRQRRPSERGGPFRWGQTLGAVS